MRDARGREITCLRLSVTDRCNLRCVYCMPPTGTRLVPKSELLTYDEIVRVVRFLVESSGLTRVRITGGEPLVRPDIPWLVERLAGLGLEEVTLTTNAQLLPRHAQTLKSAGLRRVNISIDSLKPDRFRKLTRASDHGRTLEGIEAALAAGLTPVKLNVVLMKGSNDDEVVDFVRFVMDRDLEVRFLELMSIGQAAPFHEERFVPMESAVESLDKVFRLSEMPRTSGSTSIRYAVSNGNGQRGLVGFIAPVTRPFCAECGRLRLGATGLLRGCLMSAEGIDLKVVLRGSKEGEVEKGLRRAVWAAVCQKPWTSEMETREGMHMLGG